MRGSIRLVALASATALCSIAAAEAGEVVVNHWICEMATEAATTTSIPVGCDIADATLGCPAGSPLTLEIRFEAPPDSTADVTITGAPASLRLPDAAQTDRATRGTTTFAIRPGSTVVSGFVSDATVVPNVTVAVNVAPKALRAQGADSLNSWLRGWEAAAQVKVGLKQVVRDYIVAAATVRHFYHQCAERNPIDLIALGTGASTAAVALIDARAGATCLSYESYRGLPFIPLPNLLTKGTCLERETLYTNANALWFNKQSSFWQDAPGDKMTVGLTDMPAQPVKFWVLYNPCLLPDACPPFRAAEMLQRTTRHLQNARRVWAEQFGGITFRIVGEEDWSTSTEPTLRDEVDHNRLDCDAANTVRTLGLLKAFTGQSDAVYSQHLNIFYINKPGGYGIWCGTHDPDPHGLGRDTILLHGEAPTETLAHELGHALLNSGQHADLANGFSAAHAGNLMKQQFIGEELTLGQLFRANLIPDSAVNRHGARSGPQATCSAIPASPDSCPELPLDVRPR